MFLWHLKVQHNITIMVSQSVETIYKEKMFNKRMKQFSIVQFKRVLTLI